MIRRTAHAKINLALHVTGQRADGYHLLDTLVAFAEYGDVIEVSKPHHAHGPIEFMIDGPFSEGLTSGPENLVTSAAFLLREAVLNSGLEPAPVSIVLTKNLPVASGIGGGSADAAAALLALQEYWGSAVDLEKIALGLGADVPMCLCNKPLRAQGIGEEITLLESAESLSLVLVNPGVEVSTPAIFKALSNKENSAISMTSNEAFPALDILRSETRNDLEAPAKEISPEITKVLEAIEAEHAQLSRMSGSGATCFGVFATPEAAISGSENIIREHPNWWCVATQTTLS